MRGRQTNFVVLLSLKFHQGCGEGVCGEDSHLDLATKSAVIDSCCLPWVREDDTVAAHLSCVFIFCVPGNYLK